MMPKVNGKSFPYTAAGMAAAKKAAAKKKSNSHERTESKAEKRMEYGPKASKKSTTSKSVRKNNMDK